MVVDARVYEFVLLGATGYTGKLCAEYITSHLPTNLKWAIAGRNAQKLQALVDKLKTLNPDRPQPDIEVSAHDKDSLHALAKKTRLIITSVGPYALHGEPVVEACATNGTHYLDCTGETPWVYDMVNKYHKKAQETGAILIPGCGIDSVPADILSYVNASFIQDSFSAATLTSTTSLHAIKAQPSGGTLSTLLTIFERYSLAHLAKSMRPYSLCPIPAPSKLVKPPLLSLILGVQTHPDLGHLTDSLQGSTDVAIVNRSWGLLSTLPSAYGTNFQYDEHMRISSFLRGILFHYAVIVGGAFLLLPPVRWLLKTFVFLAPGTGPDVESARTGDFVNYRNVSVADTPRKEKVMSHMKFTGSLYHYTGITLGAAAMVLVRPDEKYGPSEARQLGGGILTSACLGKEFVDRMKGAGIAIESEKL